MIHIVQTCKSLYFNFMCVKQSVFFETFNYLYKKNNIYTIMNKMDDSDLKNLDLYGILEIQQSATEKEVKTAYRKKALQYHPDKNPNNPKAAQLFLQLSKILAVLTDKAARASYDKLVNAKLASKLREKEYDAKRKKLIDDLNRKEQDAFGFNTMETNFDKEVERLRNENTELLEKERKRLLNMLKLKEGELDNIGSFKLKVKWEKNNDLYNENNLKSLFSKYGNVTTVVMLENKCVALIEYDHKISAYNARNEIGYSKNPLKVMVIGDKYKHQNIQTFNSQTFKDYENQILQQLAAKDKSLKKT